MCGITGFIDFNKKSNTDILKEMTNIIHHRGPDDGGYRFLENDHAFVGLGHKRLSILDLSSKGHQPMEFEELIIVYNGEIYNFKEIQKELILQGYLFDSNSDTEVILKSFHKWGIFKALSKFNGMFAFTIYDKKEQIIYCIRDRAGVKPFYYYHQNDLFLFGSELKSFHKHPSFKKEISTEGLASYFRYGYILAPHTIFKHTFKLFAGHYIKIDLKTKTLTIEKYWDHISHYNRSKINIGEKETVNKLETLLESAFNYRMVADVDVGVFLSGGYDSTCVTALLQKNSFKKIKTFTIGFHEKEFNEANLSKKYASILGTDHHELYITQNDILKMVEDIPFIYDEPFSDNSIFPTVLVSKFAKKYVNVALSADGGDEIFGGYTKYRDIQSIYQKIDTIKKADKYLFHTLIPFIKSSFSLKIAKSLKFRNLLNKYNKLNDMLDSPNLEDIFDRSNYFLNDTELKRLIKRDFSLISNFNTLNSLNDYNNLISKVMAVDYSTYMVDNIFVKVDRASMSTSLEAREPFMDHRILEFTARIPMEIKYKNNIPKFLIKEIVHKYIPKDIINRPKKGFSIPIRQWYEDKLHDLFEELLSEKEINKYGILDYNSIKEIIKRYNNNETYLMKVIWQIFIFQLWSRKWL